MKKTLMSAVSLLLALCLCLTLCACGGSKTAEEPAAAPAEEAPVEEAPAEEAPAEEAAEPVEEVPADEPVTLVMSTSKNQTEAGGVFLDYFCDKAEELSGGSITFERYYGGTLASAKEELSMITSGAIDVAAIMGNMCADSLPLLQFPDVGFDSNDKTTEYFRYMLLENEATAGLLAEEAAASNAMYLGYFAGGTRVWFSKSPIATIADGAGKIFGGMAGLALMEDLGFSTVPTAPPECYESLSRGIVDLCGLNLIAACDMMWYEVAPNVTIYGAYASGSPLTINLDKWNGLSAAQQDALRQAADEACAYSLQYINENEGEYLAKLEGEWGATVNTFTDEDAAVYREKALSIGCLDAFTRVAETPNAESMKTILQACADYWEADISDVIG